MLERQRWHVRTAIAEHWRRIPRPAPLIWLTLGLVSGCWLQQSMEMSAVGWGWRPVLGGGLVLGAGLVLGSGLVPVSRWSNRLSNARSLSPRRWIRWAGLLLLLLCSGGAWAELRQVQPGSGIGRLVPLDEAEQRFVRLRGTVLSQTFGPPPKADLFRAYAPAGPRLLFVLQVQAVQDGPGWLPISGRVQGTLDAGPSVAVPAAEQVAAEPGWAGEHRGRDGGMALKKKADLNYPFQVGQTVEVWGALSLPSPGKNPAQFDARQRLWLTGCQAQLFLNHPDAIRIVDETPTWRTWGARVRQYFKDLVWQHVRPDQRAMAAAILLGERSMLDPELRQQFAATGTVHVLAISGLHLGILAGFLLLLGRISPLPFWVVLLGVTGLVIGYAWLVEFRAPIVRAAVLTSAMCLAALIGRRAFSFNSLALALLVVLALDPNQLTEAGTQLSFCAVAALVLFANRKAKDAHSELDRLQDVDASSWADLWQRLWRPIKQAYLCGGIVFLACLPLVIHNYQLLAWIGLLINPLVVLPMTVALLSGFLMLIFGPVLPPLATGCGWLCSVSLDLMEGVVVTAHDLPGSHFWVSSPGWFWIVAWYVWWLVVLWFCAGRLPRWAVVGGSLALILFAVLLPYPRYPDRIPSADGTRSMPVLTVTFAEVGHGNCVVIRTPGNHVLVYDVGSFPHPHVASNRVGGLLRAHGISRIDQLLLSHADLDHYNGVPTILRQFSVGRVVTPPAMFQSSSPPVRRLEELIRQARIEICERSAGAILHREENLSCEVLSPSDLGFDDGDNSNSLVLLITYGNSRVLLTGDLEGLGLRRLLEQEPLGSQVLQIPHHGSRHSQPEALARWAQPQIAVATARQRRVAAEVEAAYREVGASVQVTGRDGAVLIGVYPDGSFWQRSWLDDPWPVR